jgi:hypothetical protein
MSALEFNMQQFVYSRTVLRAAECDKEIAASDRMIASLDDN